MKIAYSHLIKFLPTNPSIEELSDKLFQLGHEHEIDNEIFDLELTPNRGDCLSLIGLTRDLNAFFETDIDIPIYKEDIPVFELDFINKAPDHCPDISFINIEIKKGHKKYKNYLESYFSDLKIKKVNLFSDISNYIAYETGQPTHSYDRQKLSGTIMLHKNKNKVEFDPITTSNSINLEGNELIFSANKKVLNLAGVMGSSDSACNSDTTNALIECAYFKPESIIGTALKYNLNSDASHKFERGVDPLCHDNTLRRFIQIVSDHAEILKIEVCNFQSTKNKASKLDIDVIKVNKILGTDFSLNSYKKVLKSLGFIINTEITVPSYRHDIFSQNDLAEEFARVIGYNNINPVSLKLHSKEERALHNKVQKIKSFLIDNGFYEVISSSFVAKNCKNSIRVDNPLDINREYLRNNITHSLVDSLIFNERRQQDSVKLFEISDIYLSDNPTEKNKYIAIVASGKVGKNYQEFTKKIDESYLSIIFNESYFKDCKFIQIDRSKLKNSQSKSSIFSLEIPIEHVSDNILDYKPNFCSPKSFIKYKKISEFPSTYRDISFLIKEPYNLNNLQKLVLNYKHKFLKDIFIFDFYQNHKLKEVKLGIRCIFQSTTETLTDEVIDIIMSDIISMSLKTKGISIPGL